MPARGSKAFRWILRVIGWSVGIALIFPLYRAGSAFKSIEVMQQCMDQTQDKPGARGEHSNGLFQTQRLSLCMFLNSNYLESRRLEPALRDVMALGPPACEHVGIWKSARRRSVYRITLRDDNTFSGEPVSDVGAMRDSGDASGYWGENENRMVWIYDTGLVWPPDINRIESQSPDKFTLIEVNGERSEFTRERKLESARCPST